MAASDINKLMVMVEANTKAYERAMKKLEGVTNSAGKKAGKGFDPVKKALKEIETGTGRAGARITRMERELEAAAARAVKPLQLNNAQLQNMQFQISDLAQGLATGNQSPFTLIAQQGSQIAQIFGPGATVQMAFKSTGAAIASFLTNPINLAVIGIAAATAAVPILWEQFNGPSAKSAEDRLSDIDALLSKLEDGYGDAAEAAKNFIEVAATRNDLLIQVEDVRKETEGALASATENLAGLVGAVGYQYGGWSREVEDARLEIESFFNKVQSGEEDVADLVNMLQEIVLDDSAEESVRDFARQVLDAASDVATLRAQVDGVAAAAQKLSTALSQSDIRSIVNGSSIDPARFGGEFGNRSILNDINEREARKKPKKSQAEKDAEKREREIEREQEALQNLIQTIEIERELIGATALEREIANATRNLGASITEEERRQVELLAEARYREREAWLDAVSAQNFFAETTGDALIGIIDGSKSATDAVDDLTKSIARAALEAALLGNGPLAGAFGTAETGGFLGQIFSGTLGRAGGGTVSSTQPYMVGERGPELFVPRTAGSIVPNHQAANNNHITIGVDVDKSGNIMPFVVSVSKNQATQTVQTAAPAIIGASEAKAGRNLADGRYDGAMKRFGANALTRRAV